MRNAQYLRVQAEFCLQAARRISDHKTVENLRAEAARYHAEATEVEAAHRSGSKSDGLDRRANFGSADEKRAYFRLLRHLLGEGLQASYESDQVRALPSRMVELLKVLEEREPPETH